MWPVTMSHSAPQEGITPYARYRPLRLAAYGGFISIGMLATVYGAILPPLGRDFTLNLAALAGLFPRKRWPMAWPPLPAAWSPT